MNIVFVGSEASPFSKTGGLADVLGSLPKTLASLKHEVSVILPKHLVTKKAYDKTLETHAHDYVGVHTKSEYVGVQSLRQDGVTYYFVDNEYYFGYRENLYGDYDDGERYGFFNHAALKVLALLNITPDVIHCNDWQTGLIPYLVKHDSKYKQFRKVKTVFTIHNIAYQGIFSKELMAYLNTPYHDALEFDNAINFLKTGIVCADKITTVSPTYAKELQYAYFGYKMEGLLSDRKDDFLGIINGMDYEVFDPRIDDAIDKKFGLNNYLSGKKTNQEALLKMFYLKPKGIPVLGMVSRLTEAKGFPLLETALEPLLREGALQVIILGSGDAHIQDYLNHLKQKYPQHLGLYFGYSDKIARQIYAGSDFFLMPSRYEPCGLAQLISMRYGTLPVVRKTGGLKDTVEPFNKYTLEGTGFAFENYDGVDLLRTLKEAVSVYHDTKTFKTLVRRAMKEDFSWTQSAKAYIKLYESLKGRQ